MLKPQIYQHFTCPKSNNSFGPYYKILPHCFRAQLPEIIFLTKYNNLYENLHGKSNRCLCRRGKPDGIGLNWIFTKRCLFYFTYIFLWVTVISISYFCLFWNLCNILTTRCRFCRLSRYSIEVYGSCYAALFVNKEEPMPKRATLKRVNNLHW